MCGTVSLLSKGRHACLNQLNSGNGPLLASGVPSFPVQSLALLQAQARTMSTIGYRMSLLPPWFSERSCCQGGRKHEIQG